MHGRWRWLLPLVLIVAALAPATGRAEAPPFTCPGIENVGRWQRLAIPQFQPIPNVPSRDEVTAYAVAATRPELVVATNGKRLQVSTVAGCAWSSGLALGLQPTRELPLSGTNATIVSTAVLPTGRVLAAVREGTGPGSRPHVVASDDGTSGYRMSDTGLPAQGALRLLVAASDGSTVYLVLTPGAAPDDAAPGSPPLPGLPDVAPETAASGAGLLYASTDGGQSWLLRTGATDLPAGGGGLDRLVVDQQNPGRLYAISNGLLLTSNNGGRTFVRTRLPDGDVTAVEAMGPAVVAAFTSRGVVALSRDGGSTFSRAAAPRSVTSAAYRAGDGKLAVESKGVLALLDPATGRTERVPGLGVDTGTLRGDLGTQSTYHAVSAHDLLRYADDIPSTVPEAVGADSEFGVPLPTPGKITPAARRVRLRVGSSAVYGYTLSMKVSRTPLDLMLLVDTAPSMSPYLDDLKAGLAALTHTVSAAGIDLQVGVASFGTAPRDLPLTLAPPYVNSDNPEDTGSSLYRLHRRVSPVDGRLAPALSRVQSRQENGERGQLIGLDQASIGMGVKPPLVPDAVPLYLVPPNRSAAWRPDPGIRRYLVLATDQPFGNPAGSPRTADGHPDRDDVARRIAEWQRVHVVGHTTGSAAARADLAAVAAGTRTFAPRGGADCGSGTVVPAGAPLVCDTTSGMSSVTARLLVGAADLQTVTLEASGAPPHVVTSLDSRALRGIDVTIPNVVPFSLRVTCPQRSPGRWTEEVVAKMRGLPLASTSLVVDCVGSGLPVAVERPAAAAAVAAPAAPPAPAAAPAAPAAAAQAVPAVQPQVQPQVQMQPQPQVNPLTAAALQRQEELELARAWADGSGESTLAMVDRRRRDESAALVVLAAAMVACSALGLARLRRQPQPRTVRITRGG